MDSNDLFSFLDQAPDDNDDMDTDVQPEVPRKRKVNVEQSQNETVNNDQEVVDDEPGPSVPKKQRLASPPAPLVVDEVEIEAKREVAASAGLQGVVEAGARLELRHQVRTIPFERTST